MAKKGKNKKNNNELITNELKIRIGMVIIVFLIVVSALKLGIIGEGFSYFFNYLFGYFTVVIYIAIILLCAYIFYYTKLPRFGGPKGVGIYCCSIGVITILASNVSVVGIDAITTYTKNPTLVNGGLIGSILYGVFSALFSKGGAIGAGAIFIIIGLALLLSKYYIEHKQSLQLKQERAQVNASRFADFFNGRKARRGVPLPENYFNDLDFDPSSSKQSKRKPKPTKAKIHNTFEEDDSLPTKFEFNDNASELEIVDKKPEVKSKVVNGPKAPATNKNYKLPTTRLLNRSVNKNSAGNKSFAIENADRLTNVLKQFGVNASVNDIFIGPTITKYELKLSTGTRVNRIMQLQDDIKLALASKDIRIEAPIPGKPAVGVEVPNKEAGMVTFRDVFEKIPGKYESNKLAIPLGRDIAGKTIIMELNNMPHLLIAGATGSGKSVCVNTIICSILMRAKPEEVKLILVDPKKVELSNYNGIPHLLAPVVTDPKKAAATLRQVVAEMEERYDLFAEANVRNIKSYNEYVDSHNAGVDDENDKLARLPFIVVILDEVADLMLVASKDVEDCIMRLAQMARAAGIHMIVATQRPSTDIITGVIKANIPSRIAFAVSSSIDSRTILDTSGAEKLLGKGDMLYSPMGDSSPTRIQGAFVSDQEVEKITDYVTRQQAAQYDEKFENVKPGESGIGPSSDDLDDEYEECRAFVIQEQKASTSLLQRHFRIGYNKAARIIDQLEENGVIGPQLGSKPREVYIRGYEEEDI
ncbi:MAG: DNA translocase FtsK [Thomasclavelia sp.]|jgi:S-DNA-T family DNA segregation ATPase FtsK/SpoIIIE|nr:DNA translocase FtsK [Thomasclavelia sp.]